MEKTIEKNFYTYSFLHTLIGSINSVIALDCQLFALNKQPTRQKITQLYIFKDIIGQTSGLFIALHSRKITNVTHKGIQSILLQQVALTIETLLQKSPHRYILYSSVSNMLKNISWIGLGAVNSKCLLDISQKTDKDITEVFTNVNVINTIGSSIGMYLGTRLTKHKVSFNNKLYIISPLLCIVQGIFFAQMTNSLNLK